MSSSTYDRQLRQLIAQYRKEGQPWPATAKAIAVWLIDGKKWQLHRYTLIRQCTEGSSSILAAIIFRFCYENALSVRGEPVEP